MSRREYEMVLAHHEIPSNAYAIGEQKNNRVCFTNENEKWQVFRCVEDHREECHEFSKEIEACAYFFHILLVERELMRANA